MLKALPMPLLCWSMLLACAGVLAQDYPLGPDSQPNPGIPHGTVTKYELAPGKFYPGTPHVYSVYVPAQYDAAKPAPFMIFLDGSGAAGNNIRVPVVFDNLIAKHDLPKLGNPFVQANNGSDRGQGGSGLGLSVVSGLAQLHGGRLELASTLGEGTIATIILPLEGLGESGEAPPACSTVSAA